MEDVGDREHMGGQRVLRVVRASTANGPGDRWLCSRCGVRKRVADGWVLDREDVMAGQVIRAFVCTPCVDEVTRRAGVSTARGPQICSLCGRMCAAGEGAILGRVDDVSRDQVLHVPLCGSCADRELARQLTGTSVR
jgi:hypothetical protein